MRIDSSGKLLVGTTFSDSQVNIGTTDQFDPTGSNTTNGICIIQEGGTQGNGQYSTGITFSKIASTRPGAAIVSKQTSSDADQLGLAFLTHGSSSSTDTLNEAAVLDHAGNLSITGALNVTGSVTVDGDMVLQESGHRAGLLALNYQGDASWEGLSINHSDYIVNFMTSTNQYGFYDDTNNQWGFRATANGASELYYDGSSKLTTISGGVQIGGTLNVRSAIDLADNDILRFGSGDDAEFFCNGSNFFLDLNAGIGDFIIRDGTTERFRFEDEGDFLVGKTTSGVDTQGCELRQDGTLYATATSQTPMQCARNGSDGVLISFRNSGSTAGYISVSGSTVSYNGGHLSRWTQIASNSGSLLKGTVMTNLDEMCVWKQAIFTTQEVISPAVEAIEAVDEIPEERDDEGNIIQEYVPAVEPREAQEAVYQDVVRTELYYGDAVEGDTVDFEYEGQVYTATIQYEENEQLNKNAVSSVEGDPNVSGVFVNYDDDGDVNLAMTGDMVIRIAQGTTVARGDLLMSAGDGTAKPQGDDIVRSKTIAKVTSTNITKTYDEGSYLVPCVLMAC